MRLLSGCSFLSVEPFGDLLATPLRLFSSNEQNPPGAD